MEPQVVITANYCATNGNKRREIDDILFSVLANRPKETKRLRKPQFQRRP